MSLTQNYNNMLKRYLDQEMLMSEFSKENYLFEKFSKVKWMGGIYEIPVEDGKMGTVTAGGLTAESDISLGKYRLGQITRDKELFGSVRVLEADLSRHVNGKVSYIENILPDKVEQMIKRFKDQWSDQVLSAGAITVVIVAGTVAGLISVDKPELLTINQLVEFDDGAFVVKGFIAKIDINTGALFVVTTLGGAIAADLSSISTNGSLKIVGSSAESFMSLDYAILPAALGGSDVIYGLTKSDSPALQGSYRDYTTAGAGVNAITSANILDKLLQWSYHLKKQGRAEFDEHLCSYGVFNKLAQKLENNRRFTVTDKKAGYGFNSVTFIGPEGDIKITALKRMVDTRIYTLDYSELKMAHSAMFETIKDPNGNRFYTSRSAGSGNAGYSYITDIKLAGEMVYNPSKMAALTLDAAVGAGI